MTVYHYDKSLLDGLGIRAFLSEVEVRNRHIESADDSLPPNDFAVNATARALHPHMQFLKVAKVEPYAGGVQYTLEADTEKGTTELATFRPGQFIAIALEIDGHPTTRTYHLCGSPKDALGPDGCYTLMVNDIPGPHIACKWIHENWHEGTCILTSGPLGNFYPQSLRDGKRLLGLGMNGVFYSFGRAIADGLLDADLTVIYPVFGQNGFLRDIEARIMADAQGRVKIVPVLYSMPGVPAPTEIPEGIVAGPITPQVVLDALGGNAEDVAAFIDCAPFFADALKAAALEAGIPERRIHFEYSGPLESPADDPAYPLGPETRANGTFDTDGANGVGVDGGPESLVFTAIVHARCKRYEVPCNGKDTLLVSMENAGISVPSDCRSGQCGWCHSRLITGDVFIPESKDGRRAADKKFGWIHPCCTYPLSDVELEVFPLAMSE